MSTLQDAVALINAGERQHGQRILAEILSRDPANEDAWLWMSRVVERDDQRKDCLVQILRRNPEHVVAREALARLQQAEADQEARQFVDDGAGSQREPEEAGAWHPEEGAEAGEDEARGGQRATWQAPASPARDPAMMKDLADYVSAKIGKHESLDNIVLKVCEVTGMSWPEASAFVRSVEEERRPEIAGRQRPILLLLGAVGLLIGGYLAYTGASYVAAFAASIEGFAENPLVYVLSTPQLLRRLIALTIGTAILVGSLLGIGRALLPPGERSLLTSGADGPDGGVAGSIDDFIGVHVSLGDQGAASRRRRQSRMG
jgi:hypothetical protein